MKRFFRGTLLAVICLSLLVLLAGCADKATLTDTVLTIDDGFSGSRVMTFSIEESSSLILGKLTEVFRENLPASLAMDDPVVDDGTAKYTFTLNFSSLDDYKSKVSELLAMGSGVTPSIHYEPPTDDIFTSGFTLTENFTSGDLFAWAVNVAKAENYNVRIVTRGAATTVRAGDSVFAADVRISVSSSFTPLERVIVSTERYSDSEYKRTFEIVISEDSLGKIGRSNLSEKLFDPLLASVPENFLGTAPGYRQNDDGSYSYYIISSMLSPEELAQFTSCVLPGSTFEYSGSDDALNGAFTLTGTLREKLVFEPYVCNVDRTCNIRLEYTSRDNTFFENDETSISYEHDAVSDYEVEVACRTVYMLSSISVETGLGLSGKAHVSITCEYADESSSKAAAERAVEYLAPEFSGLKVYVIGQEGDFAVSSSSIGKYALRMEAAGTPSEITTALQDAFGDGNFLEISKIEGFRPLITSNVQHSVDLTKLCSAAMYSGSVNYKFTGSALSAKNVQLVINDAIYSNDILNGQKNTGGFEKSAIESPSFTLNFQYEQLNFIFILAVVLGGALILGVLGIISRTAVRAVSKKKSTKKVDAKAEAVKSVALALVPEEQRGQIAEMPKELVNRPTVMLEPHYDDGLDEDGDEPEGVWLFSTMLRLFAVIGAVLFFFKYFSVTKSALLAGNPEGVSGLKILLGTDLYGQHMEPYPLAALFIVIPIAIIILLSMRSSLPRLISPIVCCGLSAAEIFLLLRLPDVIDAKIDLVQSAVSDYITNPQWQMGYNYSLVIYILLLIGSALLIAAELIGLVTTRPKH